MLKQFLILLSVGFIVAMALLYVFQRHLIYFPSKQRPTLTEFQATQMTVISLHPEDDLTLASWYKAASAHQPTVLLLHGNAGHIGHRMPLARQLIQAGLGVLLLEYRGYGGNPGVPTEQGLYTDGRAALAYLLNQGIPLDDIVLYGESLGTAVATKLATDYSVCSVILQSPFTSMSSLAKHHYPWVVITPWDKFDSLSRIAKNHAPLMIAHGNLDELVPIEEGRKVFQNANEPKTFLLLEGKAHSDVWSAHYYDKIISFIQNHCSKTQSKR